MKPKRRMKSRIAAAPKINWAQIRAVAFDIDDTFSTDGRITSEAFAALWDLHDAGIALVPITGRPAGWCDHIARFWPVDAVIGENGAFALALSGRGSSKGTSRKLTRSDTLPTQAARVAREKLTGLRTELERTFVGLKFASDQAYREYDLAIDICEDVAPWAETEVQRLLKFCAAHGAQAKLSSIHVNTWFGDYTKRQGFEAALASGVLAHTGASQLKPENWVFIGDSPNDEPLFASFKHSVGVANLKRYLKSLTHQPQLLMSGRSGAGFVQLAELILKAKATAQRKRRK